MARDSKRATNSGFDAATRKPRAGVRSALVDRIVALEGAGAGVGEEAAAMSTPFRPIEIPPGVVAMATKKMRSSNWAEVNLCRWVEGQLAPIGGQAQYGTTPLPLRCRKSS